MVVFCYGNDTFSSRRFLRDQREKFIAKVDPTGANVTTLDGSKLKGGELKDTLSTASLFSSKRFVVVERLLELGTADAQRDVANFLSTADAEGEHVLVFWEGEVKTARPRTKKKIDAKKEKTKAAKVASAASLKDMLMSAPQVREFPLLDERATGSWIQAELKPRGVTIEKQALSTLLLFVGNDLWQLSSELDKLAGYAMSQQRTIMTDADVRLLVSGRVDANVFELLEHVGSGNLKTALSELGKQFTLGSEPLYVLTMFQWYFRNLVTTASVLETEGPYAIRNFVKLPDFAVAKLTTNAKRLKLAAARKLLLALDMLEGEVKQGITPPVVGLERFVVEACSK